MFSCTLEPWQVVKLGAFVSIVGGFDVVRVTVAVFLELALHPDANTFKK